MLSPDSAKNQKKQKSNNKENHPKESPDKKNKLRDSTIEKLLNGEKDLKDIVAGEMSTEDKVTLKKKLSMQSNGENEEINRLLEGNMDEILGIPSDKKKEEDEWVLSTDKNVKSYQTAPNPRAQIEKVMKE